MDGLSRFQFVSSPTGGPVSPNNRHETRNLKSFSLYVGGALQNVLRVGDALRFSRDQLGALRYGVERDSELILSAGRTINTGGPVALWQESDMVPNPGAGKTIGRMPIAERIPLIRPYVSIRLKDRIFHLFSGDEASENPYYLFLARANYHHQGLHMLDGQGPMAVYAAGWLGLPLNGLTKQLVREAAPVNGA